MMMRWSSHHMSSVIKHDDQVNFHSHRNRYNTLSNARHMPTVPRVRDQEHWKTEASSWIIKTKRKSERRRAKGGRRRGKGKEGRKGKGRGRSKGKGEVIDLEQEENYRKLQEKRVARFWGSQEKKEQEEAREAQEAKDQLQHNDPWERRTSRAAQQERFQYSNQHSSGSRRWNNSGPSSSSNYRPNSL